MYIFYRTLIFFSVAFILLVSNTKGVINNIDKELEIKNSKENVSFVSINHKKVFAYNGPGYEYQHVYTYPYPNTPLIKIYNFGEWTQVKDWEGQISWVKSTSLNSNVRTFIINSENFISPLYRFSNEQSAIIAVLKNNVIGHILRCNELMCIVSTNGFSGWIKKGTFFGDDSID